LASQTDIEHLLAFWDLWDDLPLLVLAGARGAKPPVGCHQLRRRWLLCADSDPRQVCAVIGKLFYSMGHREVA